MTSIRARFAKAYSPPEICRAGLRPGLVPRLSEGQSAIVDSPPSIPLSADVLHARCSWRSRVGGARQVTPHFCALQATRGRGED